MIATTALAKEYGARSLFSGVSLQLNAGSRYGLVGANGSGKSTFMRLLAGDEETSDGTVTLVKRARVGGCGRIAFSTTTRSSSTSRCAESDERSHSSSLRSGPRLSLPPSPMC